MTTILPFYTIDAFTQQAFSGNSAAVIVFSSSVPEHEQVSNDAELCQKIAAEFNLAETAFLKPLGGGTREQPKYLLRWWTPTYEIPLCGHATLASAYTLFTHYHPEATSIRFESRWRGHLIATRDLETNQISLDLPPSSLVTLEPGHRRRDKVLAGVERIVKREDVLRIDWADEIAATVVELSTNVDLEHLEFDPFILIAIGDMVILTQPAPESSNCDIHSRVFGPDEEIPEDPVTGSAHTALAPFWISSPTSLSRLSHASEINRTKTLRARQVSKRGGDLTVKYIDGDQEAQEGGGGKRVELKGWAKGVMKGEMRL